jgi:hypothetical protein
MVALACELPATQGLPLSRFSLQDLIDQAEEMGLIAPLSRTTLWRWLTEQAVQPWRHRSWIHVRDPQFEAKAAIVLDLYEGLFEGQPLGPDDFVLCADEKPRIQARERLHPPVSACPHRPVRVEHDYLRHGSLAFVAALDVQRGTVIGRTEPSTGIAPFMRLVHQVMQRRPYRRARRVFWIVDNASSHRPDTFPDRLRQSYPQARAVHLPVHASWLNQIELCFSILQRKVLTPPHFPGLTRLAHALLDFIRRYNRTAQPFQWTFTRAKLSERMNALA